ncbi:MAG: sulfatase-like hydrolase/transferase [Bacteroidales bacterium]|nr:sulfatase-like hydrolase/transferase [Bacteroidales bacterium]
MKNFKRGILFIVYLLFWLIAFELMRVFFMLFNLANGFSCSVPEFFGAMLHGLRMDLSAVAYIGIFFVPFFILFSFVKSQKAFNVFMGVLTGLMLIIVLLIAVGDAEVYRSWQFRIDASVLQYFSNPELVFASTPILRIVILLVTAILITVALFFLYKLFTQKLYESLLPEKLYSLLFIVVAGLLVILARGGIGTAPINVGTVYFCDNSFANHSAINVYWNFGSYFFASDADFDRYMYYDETFDIPSDTTANPFHGKKILKEKPEKIVFVLLESFTWTAMCYDNPSESVTPKLISWHDKGIFFSNCYASGDRSVRGIASIFSGVPSLPDYSVIKFPEKSQQLPSLLRKLADNGYDDISFYYGGDANFANMNSYFRQNGVEVVSQNNLHLDCRKASWGYDDECMFDEFFYHVQNVGAGSVSILFTLNSHEPFDAPVSPYGTDEELSRSMNAYYYTDSCLNAFLENMQQSPVWDKTLVILVSDHGKLFRSQNWQSLDKSHIVMQWLGGAVNESFVCDLPCDQADISATLLSTLDVDYDEFPFSENIFGKHCPTAFSTFGRGFSFVNSAESVWYAGDSDSFYPENVSNECKRKTKSYCQKVAEYYAGLK